MTTEDRSPGTPGPARRRPAGDPLQMSEAEKRIAEWEARHDVAARGHHAPPDVVQHYLAHERLPRQRPGSSVRPERARDGSAAEEQRPAAAEAEPAGRRSRGLLSRLFRRG